jgi:hypothetical protein
MGMRLRGLVERLLAEPTPANREAFHRGLVMSMVWSPIREGQAPDPITTTPGGEQMLTVYTDGHSTLQVPGAKSAGGGSGRDALERARAAGVGLMVSTGHKAAARAVVSCEVAPAVLALERTDDPALGTIVWSPSGDDDTGFWEFEAGPVGGRSVTGVMVPEGTWEPIRPDDLARVRQTVLWVRGNDLAVRAHIAAEMWAWWSVDYRDPPYSDAIRTPEEFRDQLTLEVIRFEPGEDAYLDYADHGLVDDYGIRIYVTPDGQFTGGPGMC